MTRKQRRLVLIGSGMAVLAVALALVLGAMRQSIVFFNSPTEIAEHQAAPSARLRMGGLVKDGSVKRSPDLRISFVVTDGKSDVPVTFRASSRTCSAKDRAWWSKARWDRAASSRPTPCWPSMTSAICRARSSMR
jgi:hypothetical protein